MDINNKEKEKETETISKSNKQNKKELESVMYIGPDNIKHNLISGKVYLNGILPSKAEIPELKQLFVPISKIVEALKDVKIQGTAYWLWYRNAEKYLKEVNNNGV